MEIKECIRRLKSDYPEDDKMYLTIQQFASESHLKENEELRKQLTWIPMSSDEKPEFNQLVMAWDAKLEKVDSYKYPGFFPLRYTHWLPIPDINNK